VSDVQSTGEQTVVAINLRNVVAMETQPPQKCAEDDVVSVREQACEWPRRVDCEPSVATDAASTGL